MAKDVTDNKRIAKNATILYFRMFFIMAISFYTSRIVLQALGVSDYGIYNVVGGVTVLINVFISALGSSTSRFLTFALGKNDIEVLKRTFTTALWVHIGLAVLFAVVAETIGLWFINTQLVIPEGRMVAANWVYQSAVVSVVMGITQTPYSASVTSHERMSTYAVIEVLLSLCKLGVAAIVLYYSGDHLVLYSILYALLSISYQCYYRFYCMRNFEECHITKWFDTSLFKDMLKFSSWTMLGSVSLTFMNQGMNVMINRFFGTLLNAASGVALQVQGLLYTFRGNTTLAFSPQIIKSYSASNFDRVIQLIGMGTKFSVVIEAMAIVPLIINMDFLMSIWLKEVPDGAAVICQILLLTNLLNSFNPFVNTAIIASGRIKNVNIVVSIIYVLFVIGTYCILKYTHSYVWAYLFCVLVSPISTIIYLFTFKKILPSFSVGQFLKTTYFPLMLTGALSIVISFVIHNVIDDKLIAFLATLFFSFVFISSTAYFMLFNNELRMMINSFVLNNFMKGWLKKNEK